MPASNVMATTMTWELSHRADQKARVIADRHYNRQKIGAPQFVPPGRCLVLWQPGAFWVTSFPFAQYVKHAWAGSFVCSAFRREDECTALSSDLIREAVAATVWKWPDANVGMVTFVDTKKTRPKRTPGMCYIHAGFEHVGFTKGGLVALYLSAEAMPEPRAPAGADE